jgi:protein MpaA
MPNDAIKKTTLHSHIHLPNWKSTSLGTAIELYASAPLDSLMKQKPILLMGGIHGDEPEGVRLATETLQWLKSNTSAEKTLCPWILIPCLNVDGFKNRERVNARGVDLNRNYPSTDWTSEGRAERYFPGTGPASEIEIQAVVEIITAFNPRLMIHCHSWQPCIVGTGSLAIVDTQRLAASSGYEGRDDIGYPTPGSLSSYGWFDKKIPVICIEEDDKINDFDLIWPRFKNGMREIFEDVSMRQQ